MPRPRMIAVVSALPRESEVFAKLRGYPTIRECGLEWGQRDLPHGYLAYATAGMGTTNTAAATQFLIDRVRPDAVMFCGIAGSLNPLLGVGDVVVGFRLHRLDADMGIIAESQPHLESFASSRWLVHHAEQELEERHFERVASVAEQGLGEDEPFGTDEAHAPRYVVGTIATSDLFSTEPDVLAQVRAAHAADCEEMEGAAAAQVAARAKLPFLAIRSISNVCGEAYGDLDSREEDLTRTARLAAHVTLGVIERIMA